LRGISRAYESFINLATLSIFALANDYLITTDFQDQGLEALSMKYMLLVYHNEQSFAKLGEATHAAMLEESIRLAHKITSRGQYLAAPLQSTSTATCVRVRDGKQVVIDGPYAETHEQLAGYFLIDAKNLDEAINLAARVPGARIGTVEIRPVRDVPGLPT
jgi:hypothetical protein